MLRKKKRIKSCIQNENSKLYSTSYCINYFKKLNLSPADKLDRISHYLMSQEINKTSLQMEGEEFDGKLTRVHVLFLWFVSKEGEDGLKCDCDDVKTMSMKNTVVLTMLQHACWFHTSFQPQLGT